MRQQDARTRVVAPLVAMAVAIVGGTPASAETVATGSINFPTSNNVYAGPEVVAFVAQGCQGNHADAMAQAIIDVRQYVGEKLLLSDNGVDLNAGGSRSLSYAFLDRCEQQPSLTNRFGIASPGSPLELTVEGEFLVLSAGGAAVGTVGVGFKLETL